MRHVLIALAIALSPVVVYAGDQCPAGTAPIIGGADPLDNGGCAPLPPSRP